MVFFVAFGVFASNNDKYKLELTPDNVSLYHSVMLNGIKYSDDLFLDIDLKETHQEKTDELKLFFEKSNFEALQEFKFHHKKLISAIKVYHEYMYSLRVNITLYSPKEQKAKYKESRKLRENLIYAVGILNNVFMMVEPASYRVQLLGKTVDLDNLSTEDYNDIVTYINNLDHDPSQSDMRISMYANTAYLAAIADYEKFVEVKVQDPKEYRQTLEFYEVLSKYNSFDEVKLYSAYVMLEATKKAVIHYHNQPSRVKHYNKIKQDMEKIIDNAQ